MNLSPETLITTMSSPPFGCVTGFSDLISMTTPPPPPPFRTVSPKTPMDRPRNLLPQRIPPSRTDDDDGKSVEREKQRKIKNKKKDPRGRGLLGRPFGLVPLQDRPLVPPLALDAPLLVVVAAVLARAVVAPAAVPLAIHEELDEHAHVQEQRAHASGQPGQVEQDVLAVDAPGLAGPAPVPLALGVEGEDGQRVGEVSEAGEQEEEHAEALGRLAPPVEQQLRQARAQVQRRAEVPEDLAPEVEPDGLGRAVLRLLAGAVPGAQRPPRHARAHDHDHGHRVPRRRLEPGGRRGRGRGRLDDGHHGVHVDEPVGPVGAAAFQQAGPLVGRGAVPVVLRWPPVPVMRAELLLGRGRDDLVLEGEAPVVEALPQQDHVRDGVVYGQYNHGGQDALEHGAQYVEDIAEEPDDDEVQGEAVGGAAAEVLDDLRAEDDDPASNGDGSGEVEPRLGLERATGTEFSGMGRNWEVRVKYPHMPDIASRSRFRGCVEGAMTADSILVMEAGTGLTGWLAGTVTVVLEQRYEV